MVSSIYFKTSNLNGTVVKKNKVNISGKGNVLNGIFAAHCDFFVKYKSSKIEIEMGLTRLTNCSIHLYGRNCKVQIGEDCNLNHLSLWLEDDGTEIIIGKHVTVTGSTHMAAIEGCRIIVGDDCLFSQDIEFRTGDSHSILDSITGKRMNPSKDITLGRHVWIGHSVKVLKGASIGSNSIIATGSIITGKSFQDHVIIGGIGGRIIKENVDWCPERI